MPEPRIRGTTREFEVRIQIFMLGAVIAAMMLFSPVSKAECNADCQLAAMKVGTDAAREMIIADIVQGGKLGRLVRAHSMLISCGEKGRAEAVGKLVDARMRELIERRMDQPLGPDDASPEQRGDQATHLMAAADSLQQGYAIGIGEMTQIMIETDKALGVALCRSANNIADKLLFSSKKS